MTTEVELKFLAETDLTDALSAWVATYPHQPLGDVQLGNTYFDTPTRQLRQWGLGLRIRTRDGQHEQTIKGKGGSVAGLHQRVEYNLPVQDPWPQLAAFPADLWPTEADLPALQAGLQPQFNTDFRRLAWRVQPVAGVEIEVAWDRGQISANGASLPIAEVELELIQGPASALFTLGASLLALGGLRPGDQSKAQRGYQLAGLTPPPEVRRMGYAPVTPAMTVLDGLFCVTGYALEQWQYHETLLLAQTDDADLAALIQWRQGIDLMLQIQPLFADLLLTLPPRPWQEELAWLAHQLAWLDEAQALARFTAEHGHALRGLPDHERLLQVLQQRRAALPSLGAMQALVRSPRVAQLLLAIGAWLCAVREATPVGLATQPLTAYACTRLDESWQELQDDDMALPQLDDEAYIHLVGKLRRNLLTGVSFAALFDAELQQGFRLPWLNILRRMEELQHLSVLDQVAAQLPTAGRLALGEWLTARVAPRLIELDQARLQAQAMAPYWVDTLSVDDATLG